VRDDDGRLIRIRDELKLILERFARAGGRFRITPVRHFVSKLERADDGWKAVYLGQLNSEPEPIGDASIMEPFTTPLSPGDPYPAERVHGKTFSVLQRDERLIAEKSRTGIHFVVPAAKLEDDRKRAALMGIQDALRDAYNRGHKISRIVVTAEGHVVYTFGDSAYFVGHAPQGRDGFLFEP
jgi:hypothetical protein